MMNSEFDNLFQSLKKMRLSGMAEELERQYLDPNSDLLDPEERISRLIRAEFELRHTKKLNRLVKSSNIRYPPGNDRSKYRRSEKKPGCGNDPQAGSMHMDPGKAESDHHRTYRCWKKLVCMRARNGSHAENAYSILFFNRVSFTEASFSC